MIPFVIEQAIPQYRYQNIITHYHICENDTKLNEKIINTIVELMILAVDTFNKTGFEIEINTIASYEQFCKYYWEYYELRNENTICRCETIFKIHYFTPLNNEWILWDINNIENQTRIIDAFIKASS